MHGHWQTQSLRSLQAGVLPTDFVGVEIWFADLAAFRDALSSSADTVLAEDERDRARSMTASTARSNFVTSRMLLRWILAARRGVAPRALQLAYGDHGKPALLDGSTPPSLHFNVSHGGDAWLCGLSLDRPIGVDVETRRSVPNAARLSTRVLSRTEQAAISALPEDEPRRDEAFLRGWTRKEAVLKAIGSGFATSARDIEAGLDTAFRSVVLPKKPGWQAGVWSVELPISGYGAAAILNDGPPEPPTVTLRRLAP